MYVSWFLICPFPLASKTLKVLIPSRCSQHIKCSIGETKTNIFWKNGILLKITIFFIWEVRAVLWIPQWAESCGQTSKNSKYWIRAFFLRYVTSWRRRFVSTVLAHYVCFGAGHLFWRRPYKRELIFVLKRNISSEMEDRGLSSSSIDIPISTL